MRGRPQARGTSDLFPQPAVRRAGDRRGVRDVRALQLPAVPRVARAEPRGRRLRHARRHGRELPGVERRRAGRGDSDDAGRDRGGVVPLRPHCAAPRPRRQQEPRGNFRRLLLPACPVLLHRGHRGECVRYQRPGRADAVERAVARYTRCPHPALRRSRTRHRGRGRRRARALPAAQPDGQGADRLRAEHTRRPGHLGQALDAASADLRRHGRPGRDIRNHPVEPHRYDKYQRSRPQLLRAGGRVARRPDLAWPRRFSGTGDRGRRSPYRRLYHHPVPDGGAVRDIGRPVRLAPLVARRGRGRLEGVHAMSNLVVQKSGLRSLAMSSAIRRIVALRVNPITGGVAVAAIGLVVMAVLGGNYYGSIFVFALCYAFVTLGMAMQVGFSNQLVLSQSAFMGLGAYGVAVLNTKFGLPVPLSILVLVVAGALVGLLLGVICMRATGLAIGLATLFIPLILASSVIFWGYLGGSVGLGGVGSIVSGPTIASVTE